MSSQKVCMQKDAQALVDNSKGLHTDFCVKIIAVQKKN